MELRVDSILPASRTQISFPGRKNEQIYVLGQAGREVS